MNGFLHSDIKQVSWDAGCVADGAAGDHVGSTSVYQWATIADWFVNTSLFESC